MIVSAPQSRYRWVPYPALTTEDLGELAAYPRVLQKLLRVRGVTTRREAEVFLTQNGSLFDPLDRERGFKNMPRAVQMIWIAVDRREKICRRHHRQHDPGSAAAEARCGRYRQLYSGSF